MRRFASQTVLILVLGTLACDTGSPFNPLDAPIAGSIDGEVSVEGQTMSGLLIRLVGTSEETATSDADGKFAFTDLPAGKYEVELVGYTTCGGCPGGNVEYAPEEMKNNGAEVVHLATGLVVGYPPCPHLEYFREFIPRKFGMEVVMGTHPIPQKYHLVHQELETWPGMAAQDDLKMLLADRETRLAYD